MALRTSITNTIPMQYKLLGLEVFILKVNLRSFDIFKVILSKYVNIKSGQLKNKIKTISTFCSRFTMSIVEVIK